jgi:hypothetical protein
MRQRRGFPCGSGCDGGVSPGLDAASGKEFRPKLFRSKLYRAEREVFKFERAGSFAPRDELLAVLKQLEF